ncbi:hypothetical protein EDD15DRAFT_2197412 [Pisolithus albus]|nr:hypothetical protein EDD15DRAFT_2197412 [Pisolithus albus]
MILIKEAQDYRSPVEGSVAWSQLSNQNWLDEDSFLRLRRSNIISNESDSHLQGEHFTPKPVMVAEHCWCNIASIEYCVWVKSSSNEKINIDEHQMTSSIQCLKKVSQCRVILERYCCCEGTAKNQHALLLLVWLHKQSLTVSHDLTSGLQGIKPESFATTQEVIFLAPQGQSLRGILYAIGRHLYAVFPTCAWAVLPLISTGTARNVQEVNLSLMDMKDHHTPSQPLHLYQKETDTNTEVEANPSLHSRHIGGSFTSQLRAQSSQFSYGAFTEDKAFASPQGFYHVTQITLHWDTFLRHYCVPGDSNEQGGVENQGGNLQANADTCALENVEMTLAIDWRVIQQALQPAVNIMAYSRYHVWYKSLHGIKCSHSEDEEYEDEERDDSNTSTSSSTCLVPCDSPTPTRPVTHSQKTTRLMLHASQGRVHDSMAQSHCRRAVIQQAAAPNVQPAPMTPEATAAVPSPIPGATCPIRNCHLPCCYHDGWAETEQGTRDEET